MLTFLGIIVLVIFVHEMGHYLAARAMGVAVDSFSIGFGKVLLKKKLWGTEWRVSLLPFGGYIMPRGEQDYNNEKNDPESFWAASPWRRAIIAVMGPVFNLLLPWPLYFMLLVGQPYPDVVVPDGAEVGRIGVVEAAQYSHQISTVLQENSPCQSVMSADQLRCINIQRQPENEASKQETGVFLLTGSCSSQSTWVLSICCPYQYLMADT